uniref:Small ribosomal subunit protein uS10 domain-containing protein n=1 Tax=uncultured Ignavibacteria bacterium Rifle_16ft_4_minimus_16666 TaxID=1665099 RepID=A0A0H4T182_9BACT|nr:hypothetical protein [uncultured Ignavibacteria bacterium Rifle_16ft_4_minimus_16666]
MAGQKIRIKLKSFDHNLIDKSAEKIIKTVNRLRSDPAADKKERVYGQQGAACRQEIARTV